MKSETFELKEERKRLELKEISQPCFHFILLFLLSPSIVFIYFFFLCLNECKKTSRIC